MYLPANGFADADELHRRPGPQRGVAARRTLQLGEAARQVVGERAGDGVRGVLLLEGRAPPTYGGLSNFAAPSAPA